MIAASLLALALAGPRPSTPLIAQATTPAPGVAATASPNAGRSAAGSPTPLAPAPAATPSAEQTTPTPLSTPTPAPRALSAPTPSPYGYRFVPRQPSHLAPGQPQIFAVYLNGKKLHSRTAIRIKVETSPDVVKVVSRSNGREGIVPLVAAGDFEATSLLPKIPFIAAGMSADLEFVATGPDGRKATVRVPVSLES